MSKKKQPELKLIEENAEDEVVKLVIEGGETHILEQDEVLVLGGEEDDILNEDEDESLVAEVDELLGEVSGELDERDLDGLFEEEKTNRHDEDEVSLRKALYESKESKASLFRNKSRAATTATLAEKVAMRDTLEDTWEHELEGELASKKTKFALLALMALLVVGAVCGGLMTRDDEVAHAEVVEQQIKEKIENTSLQEQAMIEVAKVEAAFYKFHDSKSVDDVVAVIEDGETLRAKVVSYYAKHALPQPLKNVSITRVDQELINKTQVWKLHFEKSGAGSAYRYYFKEDGAGGYKLDWRALVGCQDEDLALFIKSRSSEGKVFRFHVKERYDDGFYNWGFSDKRFAALQLVDPESDATLWGYIDLLDAELVASIDGYFKSLGGRQQQGEPLMLKVKFSADADPLNNNCILVEELISTSWVDSRKKAK